MKAIVDSWLTVQAAWLYLEPIFGSQDIRNQIPVEGKMFEEVDAHWQQMVKEAVLNTKALAVTSQDQMLENLKHSEGMLDDIQRGLNEYLEKKRLFFPRLTFDLDVDFHLTLTLILISPAGSSSCQMRNFWRFCLRRKIHGECSRT